MSTPSKTNYTQTLKFLLMFIICGIAIIIFLWLAKWFFDKSKESATKINYDLNDPNAIIGEGMAANQASNYGQDRDVFRN